MKTNKNKLLKTNRNKLMKTNKPNTVSHTRKHRTTCNNVKFGNDANNVDAELRVHVRSVTALLCCQIYSPKRR